MSYGATAYLLGRHLTNSLIVGDETPSEITTPTANATHSHLPSFTQINIPNNVQNYTDKDWDAYSSALESHIQDISIGSDFLMILLSDGNLYSMGINRPSMHLGVTDLTCNTFVQSQVLYLNFFKGRKIKKIASGAYYTLVATENNDLYGIGANDYGQFNVEESTTHKNNATPYLIDYKKKREDAITHMACCFSFSLVVTNGKELRISGQDWVTDGNYNQLVQNVQNNRRKTRK